MPSTRTGFSGHWKPKGLSFLGLHDPNHRALVFEEFNFKPETSPKLSKIVIALLTELRLLMKRVVSLANWLIFSSLPKMFLPSIPLSCA